MKDLTEETPDSGYGCAVANRFGGLLDDESDPFDLLYQAQVKTEKRKKKEDLKKVVASTKTNKKESQKDRKTLVRVGENAAKSAAAGKDAKEQVFVIHAGAVKETTGGRGVAFSPGQKRPVRAAPDEREERRAAFSEAKVTEGEVSLGYSIERPEEPFDRAARGRGGGRGRGVRGIGFFRSTDGFDPRGKREFERHSGSDRASVRPEEKRGGSGPRNWGSMRDHVSAVAEGAPNEETGEGEEVPDTTETDLENGPVETEEVLEVAIEMSLDEWKAMQEQSRSKAEFNIRKADTKLPPKAVVIHKSKRPKEPGPCLNEDDHLVCRRPAKDITCQVDINFGSLGRPTRGGRGGRGGRGRGSPVTQRSPQKDLCELAPNPDDPEDFPALG